MMKRPIIFSIFLLLTACAADRGAIKAEPEQQAVAETGQQLPAASPEKGPMPPLPAMSDPNGGRNPSYSPDGKTIAFLSSTLHTPPDLWLMDADGSNARRLTTKGVQAFAWSADGNYLMVSARRVGYTEILRITPDGAEARVPHLPPNCTIPLYSPDGKLFAFTAPTRGTPDSRELWVGTSSGERVEPVTDKISVRSFFWSPDSRRIYYEAGKSYGIGIWEFDLATMESKTLVNKYVGTPVYSGKSGLIAYPYPVNPGEFEVHTLKPDGTEVRNFAAPRLAGRNIAWDAAGRGVYYIGQDIKETSLEAKSSESKKSPSAPHESSAKKQFERSGVNSLWRLDLSTGKEQRVSNETFQLTDFALAPAGDGMILEGVTEKSHDVELFRLDPSSGALKQLVKSKPSVWMPVPSSDSAKIAFITNDAYLDEIKVVSYKGEELAAHTGLALTKDTRLFWLPQSEGLVLFSGNGVTAFTDKHPIEFPNEKDHRVLLFADASIQEDKLLISSIPQFGQNPGLYMLEAVENKFVQSDLRYPPPPDMAAEYYLQPRWSFDGKKIAFSDGIDIWTMTAAGKGRTWITSHAQENSKDKEKQSYATYPIWSSRGDKICFTLTVYYDKEIFRQLWLINADGSNPRMLFSEQIGSQFQVFMPEFTNQPFFDGNDEHIIFTAADNGIPNIFSVDIKSGKASRLTETGAIYPALLPEEGVIVYVSLEGNRESLFVMNSDGSEKRPFVVTAKPGEPAGKTAPLPAVAEPSKSADKPAEPAEVKAPPAGSSAESAAAKAAEKGKKKASAKKKKPSKK